MMIRLLQRIPILLLAVLSACSTVQQTAPTVVIMDGLANNRDIQQWSVSGKVGLRSDQQAHSAYLNWRQCGEAFDIRLSGPLGQGAAHLTGDSKQVYLVTADKQRYSASNTSTLLKQQFGWTLPMEQLRYWLRALPDPNYSHRVDNNNASGFKQQAWQLSYPRFIKHSAYQLPSRIIAEQPTVKVTVVINQWQLDPDCNTP